MASDILQSISDVQDFKKAGLAFSGSQFCETDDGGAWRFTLKRGKTKVLEASNGGYGGPSELTVFSQSDLKWLVEESGLLQKKLERWNRQDTQIDGQPLLSKAELTNPKEELIADALSEFDADFQLLKSLSQKAKKAILIITPDCKGTEFFQIKAEPTKENLAKAMAKNPGDMILNGTLSEIFPSRTPGKSPSMGM